MEHNQTSSYTILAENHKPWYSMTTIFYNDQRFKFVVENGNSYFRASVLLQTKNGDWATMYTAEDIPDLSHISYVEESNVRLLKSKKNIKTMISLVMKVF